MDTPIEPYYQQRAKELTNLLYDKGFLADDLSRESIGWLEEYLGFLFQSHSEMSVKAAALSAGVRDLAARPKGERQEQPQEERQEQPQEERP